jgi:hypothetical protein
MNDIRDELKKLIEHDDFYVDRYVVCVNEVGEHSGNLSHSLRRNRT